MFICNKFIFHYHSSSTNRQKYLERIVELKLCSQSKLLQRSDIIEKNTELDLLVLITSKQKGDESVESES